MTRCSLFLAWLVGTALALLPQVAAAQGGPNNFGYSWDPVAVDFVTRPSSSSPLTFSSTDDGEATVTLPASWDDDGDGAADFPYYGASYSTMIVSTNGAVGFDPSQTQLTYVNVCLPANSTTSPELLVFWDDLNPGVGGSIYAWHDITGGADRYIVSWEGVAHYGGSSMSGSTFQLHLYPSGTIEMHYVDLDFNNATWDQGLSATIGIQDISTTNADPLQYSCNTATTLEGTGLRFSTCEDLDLDGHGAVVCGGDDCDDGDDAINPDAAEVCDGGIDNDCDASTDENVDADGDGQSICGQAGDGSDGDCDDSDTTVLTGGTELCDGLDNDCLNGPDFDAAGEADADADGFVTCSPYVGANTALDGGDCDDNDPQSFPGNPEVCDGADNDCDGNLPAIESIDADGDSSPDCFDCDNANATIYPGAAELCDGLDNDCDGQLLSGGNSGTVNSLTTTFAAGNGSSGNIFEVEVLQDLSITSFDGHLTSSGSGTVDVYWKLGTAAGSNTTQGDWTFHEQVSVVVPAGQASGTPTPVPLTIPLELSAGETYSIYFYSSLGIRYTTGTSLSTVAAQDSNLIIYEGYGCGASFSCTFTPRVWNGTVHYLIGSAEEDADQDGFVTCAPYVGLDPSLSGGDCDDNDGLIYPGATELCDGIDNDCSNGPDFDAAGEVDGDGDGDLSCSDCDDNDNQRYTGNTEVCDGVDNDCDGSVPAIETIDADGDTSPDCYDCDSADPTVYPGATEICDGLDNDCDGQLLTGGSAVPNALTTTFASGSGSSGNIFDLDVLETISITGFDGHLTSSGSGTVDVYWKLGTAAGSNTTQGDWTFHEQVSVVVPAGQATGTPTPVPLTTPLELSAGETYSIYFYSSLGIRYTVGTSITTVAAQDSNLTIYEGYGCGGSFSCSFGPPNGSRIWNGTIHYLVGGSAEDDGDQDGFFTCSPYVGSNPALAGGDCDDDEATAYPGAVELCDFIDNNCDQTVDEGHDQDADGQNSCDGDCDDADPNNFLGNDEVCDGADNDCDAVADDLDAVAEGLGAGTAFPNSSGGAVAVDAEVTVDAVVTDVNVTVDLSHPALQEVSLVLLSPSGTAVELSSNNGGSGANYTATTFDDQALNSIVSATAPMTGSYYPQGSLADFNGEGTLGTWQLEVRDSASTSNDGTIDAWSLEITIDADADGDGYLFCNAQQPGLQDCDDAEALVYPGASELCNAEDDDCDGLLPADEQDGDGDGYIACEDCDDASASAFPGNVELCDGADSDCDPATDENVDGDGDGASACAGDCDDATATVYVGAPELCNGVDDDCNGVADADAAGEVDADVDGSLSCVDCDDAEGAAYPGNIEVCDGLDNDCDPSTDESQDNDGDGASVCAGGDCNDAEATVYQGATEICDGLDNDCDGNLPADEVDGDGDGSVACADCDDAEVAVFPGNPEICDGLDNDCDSSTSETLDFDGDLVSACGGDCDEGDVTVYPGAAELCDDLDNDCNPSTDEEIDGDGDGDSACDGDCDDLDDSIYVGAVEACDGLDSDCDGAVPAGEDDADGDGVRICDDDCDDADATMAPGLAEQCDGLDNDCDGSIADEEQDADGDGFTPCEGDCDDTTADSLPGAAELCDGLDNDCDLNIPEEEADADADGFRVCDDDCDDAEAAANPGATEDSAELCTDQIDNDCDGDLDEADADCDELGDDDDSAGSADDDDDSTDPQASGCQCESSIAAVRGAGSGFGMMLGLLVIAAIRRRR